MGSKMNVILIEDSPAITQNIQTVIEKHDSFQLVKTFVSYDDFISEIKNEHPHFVFVNMDMDREQGLQIVRSISVLFPEVQVILMTSDESLATLAFEIGAFDFILKPVCTERIEAIFERILKVKDFFIEEITDKEKQYELNPDLIKWRSQKGKQLFIFLYEHKDQAFSSDELIERFWGEFPRKSASHYFYTAIYNIRKSLKDYPFVTIKNINRKYILQIDESKLEE